MKAYRAAILRFADDRSAVYERGRPAGRRAGRAGPAGGARGRRLRQPRAQLCRRRNRAPAGAHHRAGLHRPAHPLSADRHDRLARCRACCPGWRPTPFRTRRALPTRRMRANWRPSFSMSCCGTASPRALAFATSHPASVNALMAEAQRRQLRLIAGKVLQDRHSPDGVRDETEQSPRRHRVAHPANGTASIAWATRSRRATHRAAAKRSCAAPANWPPAIPRSGSSRTWPRTWTKSSGRASCFPIRAATWRSTTTSA